MSVINSSFQSLLSNFVERAVPFLKETERSTEMTKHRLNLTFMVVLCCSLALAGCRDAEKEEATGNDR